jgi:GrpB-like predicted nucleotidyltransferase (UPF0157 family)
MRDDRPPLGLESGKVALAESDPRWEALFEAEKGRLRSAIGPFALDIQHFGSTSIPGIKAKPILDILVGLPDFETGSALVAPMTGLGYDYVGVDMVPDDHLFGLGEPRTHLVHAVVHGGHHWNRNLRFRDQLRARPALAEAYEALKVDLAARFADNRAGYTAAKQAFIDSIADG